MAGRREQESGLGITPTPIPTPGPRGLPGRGDSRIPQAWGSPSHAHPSPLTRPLRAVREGERRGHPGQVFCLLPGRAGPRRGASAEMEPHLDRLSR